MSKLYRSRRDKMVTGLCGGLSDLIGMDSTLLRILFIVTVFFTKRHHLVHLLHRRSRRTEGTKPRLIIHTAQRAQAVTTAASRATELTATEAITEETATTTTTAHPLTQEADTTIRLMAADPAEDFPPRRPTWTP